MRRTSTQAVVRSSSATARAINGGRSGWTVGHGRTSSRGWSSGGTAGPATVLRGARPDTGTAVRSGGHPRATASHRGSSRSAAPVRAAPTPACPRSRDVTRRDLAARHPETARACRPRDHVPVPARDRQHRDHCRSSRAACSDDPGRPTPATSPLSPLRQTRQHREPNGCGGDSSAATRFSSMAKAQNEQQERTQPALRQVAKPVVPSGGTGY